MKNLIDIDKALSDLLERVEWLESDMKEKEREIESLNDRIYRLDSEES